MRVKVHASCFGVVCMFLDDVDTSFKHALHSQSIVPGLFERVADSLLCCARLYCISHLLQNVRFDERKLHV